MTFLPSLIKKIDDFYKLAAPPAAWTMPDEPEEDTTSEEEGEGEAQVVPHFDDLMAISHQVDDPGLSQQLRVLAELYRYAINMGGGYATIAKAINNLKNAYNDGADSNIEFILNGMIKELAKQAGGAAALGGKDNPNFVQRLAQLKQDIEDRERSEQSGALDAYNEQISAPGAADETPEELAESGLSPEEAEIVNPAALGFGDKDNPRTNKGWHTVGSGKPYKNWKEYYDAERASYEAQLATEANPQVRDVLTELVRILPELSQLTDATLKKAGELKVAPSQQGEAEKAQMLDALQKLKEKRQLLKNSIRSTTLQRDKQKLTEELGSTRDERQKMLLEQEIALKDLALSGDVYKAKERNYRQALIDSMSGGNFPGLQTLHDFLKKIKDASELRVSKSDYDRSITLQRGKEQGRQVTPEYEKTRGGRRVPMELLPDEERVNFENASFKALVKKFQDDVASASQAARQSIYRAESGGRAGKENPAYKAIIDEISKAIRDKNRQGLYDAKNKLVAAVANDMFVQKNQLKGYVEVIRLEPHFRKVLETIRDMTKTKKGGAPKLDDAGNLLVQNFDEKDKSELQAVLNDIYRLRLLYQKYYTHFASIKSQQHIVPRFVGVISDMGKIETYLGLKLHVQRPEKTQRYPEKSPLLKEISKEKPKSASAYRLGLLALAQEIKPEGEIDQATADKLANDIFNQVFDAEYQKMLSELAA